jgi:hypothetical protein
MDVVACPVIEIWRQDAVYRFDFWPEAVVKPPTEIVFALEHARFGVGYTRDGDGSFESAREVAEAQERRVQARTSESLPMVTSGVLPVTGCVGEAWRSTVGLANEGMVAHLIACDMGDGVVATLNIDYRATELPEPSLEVVEAVARRVERGDIAKLTPREDELEYELGPLRVLTPKAWTPLPTVDAGLNGEQKQWVGVHHLGFEFSDQPEAPRTWLDTSTYVDSMLLIDGVMVAGEPANVTFPAGNASANAWAALPPPDDDDPDDVDTEAIAVVQWSDGNACKLSAKQETPYAKFSRERDLARLRDLVLRIAMSSSLRRRPAFEVGAS